MKNLKQPEKKKWFGKNSQGQNVNVKVFNF